MSEEKIYLDYLKDYNAYGVKDEVIEDIRSRGNTPLVQMKPKDWEELSGKETNPQSPTIGFLMGREKGLYTIDYNYAKSIAQSGVNINFLDFDNAVMQLDKCDGLVLPGGAFDSPNEFYTDPLKQTDNTPGKRSYAYIKAIMEAEKSKKPILAICAGAQLVGGMNKMKMYRNLKGYTTSQVEHKSKNPEAHQTTIYPDNILYEMLGRQKEITTNSRHSEGMMNFDADSSLKIYAASSNDGIPEAWGSEERNILCIQWHPEDFAAKGDRSMQNIYNWVAKKAQIYQKQSQKQSNEMSLIEMMKRSANYSK